MSKRRKFNGLWWSKKFFIAWVLVAILAPILANKKAIIVQDESGILFFPRVISAESKVLLSAPVPYDASTLDLDNSNAVGPFEKQQINSIYYRHWLGTDGLGRDVLANLIHGSKTALFVGFGAMGIAAIIGVFLGSIAAYYGDHKITFSRSRLILLIILLIVFLTIQFYAIPWDIGSVDLGLKLGLFVSITSLFLLMLFLINYFMTKLEINNNVQQKSKGLKLPVDLIIGRIIEVMDALPLLFIIIALSAIFSPSIKSVIVIIGISSWAGIARYTRAETLKIKELEYIEGANALGFPAFKTIWSHILPNAISPVLVSLSFGIAAAILIEATLSFIGMGLSTEEASWGKLIAEARVNYGAWWLAIFPGLAIFFAVLSCNIFGDRYLKSTE